MAWYDDVLKTVQQPFEGVGDAFSEMNLLGASVPESFEMMKDSGLLGEKEYQSAVDKANARGTRNALLKGLITYGTQDFSKGYGSALDPRYLRAPALTAMNESQKALDRLPKDVATQYQMAGLKRTADDAATRAAYVKELKSGKYGEFTEAQLDLAGSMTTPQLVDMIQGKSPQFKTLVDDQGLSQDYIVKGPDVTNWIPVGSKRQEDNIIPKDSGRALTDVSYISLDENLLGFKPKNNELRITAASDIASMTRSIQKDAADKGISMPLPEARNKALTLFKESKAYKPAASLFEKLSGQRPQLTGSKSGEEEYNAEEYINYYNAQRNSNTGNQSATSTDVVKVTTQAEAMNLKPGTKFMGTDGIIRTR